MPLIVFVGGPSCGKTLQANKLKEYLTTEKKQEVILVNEEILEINREEGYKDFNTEKNLRGKIKSEVEKHLDDKKIVIVDYLNYIKGFRYELYCLVRNFKTRLCVIYLKIDLDICLKFNQEKNNYSEELLKDLYSRMEEPQGKNRWDSPLYQVYFGEELPYEEIYTNISEGRRPAYGITTAPEISFDSNFLQELELSCTDINNKILEQQKDGLVDSIKIDDFYVYLKKVFSGSELKKLKQEFTKICKIHPPKNKISMMKMYIEYINSVQERY